jgi:hypothetical protein
MSKYSIYDDKIKELILIEHSNSKIAQILLKTTDSRRKNKEVDTLRTYVYRYRNSKTKTKEETTETITNDYKPKTKIFTAVASDGKIMNIETYCKFWGLDFDKVRSFKLVSHTGTPFYNIAFYETEIEKNSQIDFANIFKNFVKEKKVLEIPKEFNISEFDRLVFTDVHVGMDVNKDGYSLYSGNWNEEEINNRLILMLKSVRVNSKSNKLIINDLGDYLDGWDGMTTRGGHKLPQNMDNQKAFDVALKFKITLIDALIRYYDDITMINICNDNHAGSFGYIVNSAFKTYIEMKYPKNVKVINQRKFIDHYIVENRCFILTHGKDDKSLKFGFKPKLDAVQIEKIKDYIDEYKLHQYKIEFSKGDSHQLLLDWTSSASFEYQNFGAFSPPSDWVKTNFKNTTSSFMMFNYYKEQKTLHPFIFNK